MASLQKQTSNVIKVCGRNLEEVRVLGVGGQGSVSLCKDRASGKLFALKTAASRDLAHEFYTVRSLMDSGVQDGIVQVHDIDTAGSGPLLGKTFILMGFCNGGNLLSELKRHPGCRLGDRQAAAVVRSVAESLLRCHEVGIMHRDIKPENILLCRSSGCAVGTKRKKDNGDAWLRGLKFMVADFGLAHKFKRGHLIRDGYVVGTNQYIAPEMIQGAYDERADVWSLGVLLHVILTGNFPSHIRNAHRQLSGPSESRDLLVCMMEMCPDELDLGAPMYSQLTDGARSLLAGMLRKNPGHRFTLSEHAALSGIKRVRFTMPWGPDIVRELRPVQMQPTNARIGHPGPLVLPKEIKLLPFNLHVVQAAY